MDIKADIKTTSAYLRSFGETEDAVLSGREAGEVADLLGRVCGALVLAEARCVRHVRHPIKTLPEERDDAVLVFGLDALRQDVVSLLWPGQRPDQTIHMEARWTSWSPLPPPAEEQDAPASGWSAPNCRDCSDCVGAPHHGGDSHFGYAALDPDHPAAQAGHAVWQGCKHCTAWCPLESTEVTLPTPEEVRAELRAAGLEPGKVGREMRLRLEASSKLSHDDAYRLALSHADDVKWDEGARKALQRLGFYLPDATWREVQVAADVGLQHLSEILRTKGVGWQRPDREPSGPTCSDIAEFLEFGLAEGWCSACKTDLRPHGPDTRPTDDDTAREWVCPECEHTEPDAPGSESQPLTLDDLRPLLVEGWEMPAAPVEGAVPRACFVAHRQRWALMWTTEDEWGPCSHGHIRPPFREGVNVTVDMLRVLGFVVDEGAS